MVGFGLNQALSDGIPLTMAGTQEYAAPEVLDGGSPSEKQDVCLSLSRWWFETLFICTPNIGEMIQVDEHIFQMGWFNHQLVVYHVLFEMFCPRRLDSENVEIVFSSRLQPRSLGI